MPARRKRAQKGGKKDDQIVILRYNEEPRSVRNHVGAINPQPFQAIRKSARRAKSSLQIFARGLIVES